MSGSYCQFFAPVLASPLYFGSVTLAQLTAVGGAGLPTSNPGIGTNQLWNDGNVVAIA